MFRWRRWLTQEIEFLAAAQLPLDFLAGFQADGGGQRQGHSDEQSDRSSL